jgi:hypothetical protein
LNVVDALPLRRLLDHGKEAFLRHHVPSLCCSTVTLDQIPSLVIVNEWPVII